MKYFRTREWPNFLVLKLMPKRTLLENMAVVASSSKVWVYIEKLQIGTGHSKHIDAKRVVSVNVVGLILLWWDHPDVTSINATCSWGESTNLEEVTCKFGAIVWPFDHLVLQGHDAVGHTMDDSTHCWWWWALHVTQDMIKTSSAQKMEKQKNLKQILKYLRVLDRCQFYII